MKGLYVKTYIRYNWDTLHMYRYNVLGISKKFWQYSLSGEVETHYDIMVNDSLFFSGIYMCLSTDRILSLMKGKFLYWHRCSLITNPIRTLCRIVVQVIWEITFFFFCHLYFHIALRIFQGCLQLKATGQHNSGCFKTLKQGLVKNIQVRECKV